MQLSMLLIELTTWPKLRVQFKIWTLDAHHPGVDPVEFRVVVHQDQAMLCSFAFRLQLEFMLIYESCHVIRPISKTNYHLSGKILLCKDSELWSAPPVSQEKKVAVNTIPEITQISFENHPAICFERNMEPTATWDSSWPFWKGW